MDILMRSRRMFMGEAVALLASMPALRIEESEQTASSETPTHWIDLPPNTTLWGVIAFFSMDLVEISVGTREDNRTTFRGRFAGKRLIEFSWSNRSGSPERIGLRATALGAERELGVFRAHQWADNVVIGFGQRATPEDREQREGAYPHEAVLVGFRVAE